MNNRKPTGLLGFFHKLLHHKINISISFTEDNLISTSENRNAITAFTPSTTPGKHKPTQKEICALVAKSRRGADLKTISKSLGSSPEFLRATLKKLVHKNKLKMRKGSYYLQTIQNSGSKSSRTPVPHSKILDYLHEHPSSSISQIASGIDEKYQRIIKLVKKLQQKDIIKENNKLYSLSE